MLKFESLAKVGDTIGAYDFMSNTDRFIVGDVIAKGTTPGGFEGYTIKIFADSGKTTGGRCGDIGYVPFEVSFMEYDTRVNLLCDAEANEAFFGFEAAR